MFSGLTNLLFGNKKTENNRENLSDNNKSPCNISFKTKEDDGWVVVSGKKKRRRASSDFSNFTDVAVEDMPPSLNLDISCDFEMDCEISPTSTSPVPPLAYISPVSSSPSTPSSLTHLEPDGGWYLTPPPCFTAGNNVIASPVLSPMENLLIEHPSMSVYQRPTATQVEADLFKLQDDKKSTAKTTSSEAGYSKKVHKAQEAPAQPAQAATYRSAGGLVFAELFKKDLISEGFRLKNEKYKMKNLCRNQLERNNKNRDFSSTGKLKHRKDRLRNNPSGVNNNRKC